MPHISSGTDTTGLAGKVAVVTGGSRGIGAATARALGARGARVVVVGRDRTALAEVAASISAAGATAIALTADCVAEDDLAKLVAEVHDRLGPVDVLMAFAGGNGMPVATAEETADHWRDVLDGDLTATFLTIRAFLIDLSDRAGAVVTMSSESGRRATRSSAAYAAAKGGVVALSRHLAGELAPRVRVNCLAPGTIENERIRARLTDEQRRALTASFPLGRIGRPADAAEAAVFLASDAASWITGATLDLAGGRVMG